MYIRKLIYYIVMHLNILPLYSRLRCYVPTNTLLTIYRFLIFPYPTALLYGAKLHKLTLIKFWPYKSVPFASYTLLLIGHMPFLFFVFSNTIPVNMLYFKSFSILMHDVFNKLTPCSISNLFNCLNEIHNYNTRFSSAGNYNIN